MNPPDTCLGLCPGDSALVVCPHLDDETLGAGGTIARFAAAGIIVHVLAVTCLDQERLGEFDAACDALGVARRTVAWVSGDRASAPGAHIRELVTLIESGPEVSVRTVRPAALLIPWASGFHQDHHAVHRAGFAAARPRGTSLPAPRIVLGYAGPEDCWTTAAEPQTVYVDTTASWPAKQKALSAYATQMRDDPHPRSICRIQAADTAIGAAIGTGTAERFVPYRLAF